MEEKMNRVRGSVVYLIILIGGGFIAWLIYEIICESYVKEMPFINLGGPPKIVITSPANAIVSQSLIQIMGYYPGEIQQITFDITNAAGANKHQFYGRRGFVTGHSFNQAEWSRISQFLATNKYDPHKPDAERERLGAKLDDIILHQTNLFQIFDVNLVTGKNRIVIHVRDTDGRRYSTKRFYTLDYSHKTSPVIKLIWPQDKTEVAGDRIHLKVQVDDPTDTVEASVKNSKGEVQSRRGVVERSGVAWIDNLPIGPGTNTVKVVAVDAIGNSSTNTFSVIGSPVRITVQPIEPKQLTKSFVNIKGTVSDTNYGIRVNGVEAVVNPDGTWEAKNVPVPAGGTAEFVVKAIAKKVSQ